MPGKGKVVYGSSLFACFLLEFSVRSYSYKSEWKREEKVKETLSEVGVTLKTSLIFTFLHVLSDFPTKSDKIKKSYKS